MRIMLTAKKCFLGGLYGLTVYSILSSGGAEGLPATIIIIMLYVYIHEFLSSIYIYVITT